MSAAASALPYRPCVGVTLFNADAHVFVGQRIDSTTEAWQMPQGGMDPGETPLDTALRELEEEIGTAKGRIIGEINEWLSYDLPAELIGRVWKGRYRGQRQRWFAMAFDGTDADINLDTKHPEFNAWQWVELEALPDLIVPFKRDLYAKIVDEFRATRDGIRAGQL